MEKIPFLLQYDYYSYCQGTRDRNIGYALIYNYKDATFNNTRSILINERHVNNVHEIIIDSIKNLTIL